MAYAAANIVEFVRGFGERKKAKEAEGALKNYLTDPNKAIQELNQINPVQAIQLQDKFSRDEAAKTAAQESQAEKNRQRQLVAVKGIAQILGKARDKPDADLGATYDGISPILKNGFGLSDEEVAQYREQILANPTLIDAFYQDAEEELKLVTPGSTLTRNGVEVYRNPVAITLKDIARGDGGRDVVTFDPSTGEINPAVRSPGGGSFAGQSRGSRNNNKGNIKDGPFARSQPGYKGSDGTFAIFDSEQAGNAAQENLLRTSYFGKGVNTVNSIIDKYLGPGNSENTPESRANYKKYVADRLKVSADAQLSPQALPQLAQALREFETGERVGGGGITPQFSTPGKAPTTPKGKLTPEQQNLQKYTTINDARDLASKANELLNHPSFDQATGSIQGALPSIFQGTVDFDKGVEALRDKVVLNTIANLKKLSATGATGFGNLTEKEGRRLENALGTLDQKTPTELKKTLRLIIRDSSVIAGYAALDGRAKPEAIRMLVDNPALAPQFDEVFGEGASNLVLGN